MDQVVSLCIGSEPELHRLELLAALSYAMAAFAERTVSVNDEELAYVDLLDTLLLKHNYNPVEMDDSDKFTFCRLLRTEVSRVVGLEFPGQATEDQSTGSKNDQTQYHGVTTLGFLQPDDLHYSGGIPEKRRSLR